VYRAGPHPITDQPGGSALTTAARAVVVSSDARARVVAVAVRPGVRVRSLQPLLVLDPSPFQKHGAETGPAPLLSPIDGVIATVGTAPGEVATPGAPPLTVEDDSHLHVAAMLPVADRPLVVPGALATVSVPTLPGVVLQGRVIEWLPTPARRTGAPSSPPSTS
jgi:multidrug resistance efflux pump